MQLSTQFSAISGNQRIDKAAGIIYGVSVITEGPAVGHDCYIDETTLKQVKEAAEKYSGGLKVKMDHWSGVGSIVGTLQGFSIDGKQLRSNFHLLDKAEQREQVLEMAEKMPESFGFSISFSNLPETIDKDGIKVKYARCAEIYSADLVDSPAANPSGLFSKPNTAMNEPTVAELAAQIGELKTQLAAIKPADLKPLTDKIEAATTQLSAMATAAETAKLEAKKTEIAALVAEAGRDGKVIPLTDAQLSKMEIADVKEMISKLPVKQVTLAKKPVVPAYKEGKELRLSALVTDEDRLAASEFCRNKQAEGLESLTAIFKGLRN